MRSFAIVGAGESGVQLALGLRERGHDVTLVSDRDADSIRTGEIMSSQCVFGSALAAQESLDIATRIRAGGVTINGIRLSVLDDNPVSWLAPLDREALSVDQRLKVSSWMDDFEAAGGTLHVAKVGTAMLERLAADHDLVIIATGKGELSQLFATDRAKSPYDRPQRVAAVAYVNRPHTEGAEASAIRMSIRPGIGEFFTFPGLTLSGECQMMVFEGIPGGPMDAWSDISTPEQHLDRCRELLETYFPEEAAHFAGMRLTDDGATLRGRITPTVRRPVGTLPSGALVLGMGDAVLLNDPLTGQGSNNAALAAQHYEEAIIRRQDRSFDVEWMTRTFEEFWRGWGKWSTLWTNSILAGLAPHQRELVAQGATHPGIAGAIANGFDDPRTLHPWWAQEEEAHAFAAETIADEEATFDLRDFRNALGQFATGVAVITTLTPDGRRVGMTANSFTSVSMDPPLVLWCPAKRIPSLGDFEQASHFAINVLATEQHALSRQFATPSADKFDGVSLSEGRAGLPVLEGTVATFQCRTVARHDAGDHVIYVGEVEEYRHEAGAPLVFHAGAYHNTATHQSVAR